MNEMLDRIVERIREGRSFLVSSHLRLDGDGIGSALALHLLLKDLGKTSRVVMPGRIPDVYRFLPGADEARRRTPLQLVRIPALHERELPRHMRIL